MRSLEKLNQGVIMLRKTCYLLLALLSACATAEKPAPIETNLASQAAASVAAGKSQLLERRKSEVATANANSPHLKLVSKCSEGGIWGNFTQNPKFHADAWDISHVKGNFKTFTDCELARKKQKNSFFTEQCEPIKEPPAQKYELAKATFQDYSGNHHNLHFSTSEICQKAISAGFNWYRVEKYQISEDEESVIFISSKGKDELSFISDCEIVSVNACDGNPLVVQQ